MNITNKFKRSRKDIVPFWLVKPLVGRSHIIKEVLYWMFRTVVFVDWLIFGQQFSKQLNRPNVLIFCFYRIRYRNLPAVVSCGVFSKQASLTSK